MYKVFIEALGEHNLPTRMKQGVIVLIPNPGKLLAHIYAILLNKGISNCQLIGFLNVLYISLQ